MRDCEYPSTHTVTGPSAVAVTMRGTAARPPEISQFDLGAGGEPTPARHKLNAILAGAVTVMGMVSEAE